MKNKINKIFSNKKILIGVIILLVLGLFVYKLNFTKSIETPSFPNQTVESLTFTDASILDNKLTVIVKNDTENDYNLKTIDVSFVDSSGNTITTIKGYVGNTLKSNDSKKLVVQTDKDISNTSSITYNINK
ncbi:MAG TPA: hypothetical protein PKG93_01615 [Bacilli bacterium]|nr:hypothetical protein [Bacilli bacterium]